MNRLAFASFVANYKFNPTFGPVLVVMHPKVNSLALPTQMIIRGRGVLARPLHDFAEDLHSRFPNLLRVLEHHQSSDGLKWQIRCTLMRNDTNTLAEIKDYIEIYFPTDVGGELEINNAVIPLFEIVPNIFFVLNASNNECRKVEIQLLDRFCRAREWGTVLPSDPLFVIGSTHIPRTVVDAGLRQPMGTGDFVDLNGVHIDPLEPKRKHN